MVGLSVEDAFSGRVGVERDLDHTLHCSGSLPGLCSGVTFGGAGAGVSFPGQAF